ncbi:unnamed protein product, partial [Discosporangium mesarthrocarpum]
AAALAVGNRLAADVAGLKQAQVNAGQGVSMLQIADGAMSKVNDILQRMKTLSVQAGSEQISGTERTMLNTEYQALVSEIDRISSDTEFAGIKLVDGEIAHNAGTTGAVGVQAGITSISFQGNFDLAAASSGQLTYGSAAQNFTFSHNTVSYTGALSSTTNDGSVMSAGDVVTLTGGTAGDTIDLVIGASFDVDASIGATTLQLSGASEASFTYKVGTGVSASADEIAVNVNSISTATLGISSTDILSTTTADTASLAISNAIDDIQTYRAEVGANQNRLEFAAANIATTVENTEAARSALLDLDVAQEMSNFTSKQILVQAGVAMLSQANQLPQNLLRLLQ